MSRFKVEADYTGAYPEYSEADILDFITHGNVDVGQESSFGVLEGAEDMVFTGFDPSQASSFVGGLSDSTDQLDSRFMPNQPGQTAPMHASQHAAFLASTSVGVSSFKDLNARSRLEQQQMMQQPITPLRDTPHTPTNSEHNTETQRVAPGVSHHHMRFTTHNTPALMSHRLALNSQDIGAENEATELREFIAPGSLETDPDLDQIRDSIENMQRQVDEMRSSQTQALQALCENLVSEQTESNPHIANLQQMLEYQTECHNTAIQTLNAIFEVQTTKILSTSEVDRANSLHEDLQYLLANLALLSSELSAYLSWVRDGGDPPTLAQLTSLVISRTPFPSIWMKRNQMSDHETIYVNLLHGCSVTLNTVSEVHAQIICHTSYAAKTTPAKPIIDYDMFVMDPNTLTAGCQFVFTAGSRKDVAQCRFSMTVQGSSFATSVLINRGNEVPAHEVVQLTSNDSKPFIVITNECQYGETFGILFYKDVFMFQWGETEPRAEIPWALFANAVQRYFVRSSRKDPTSLKRGLSNYDLEHIHSHFFASSPTIDMKQVQKFWEWYGKVLHRLRYQRHVSALWNEGLIFGMVSREGVMEQLISRPPGTFLLRFSESSAGFIAVGYRVSGANAGIKNYLVKQEDTASATVKTLPDFLRSRPEFSVILQYTGQHLDDGFPVLYPIHKDYALKAYCAVRPPKPVDPKVQSPYDEL